MGGFSPLVEVSSEICVSSGTAPTNSLTKDLPSAGEAVRGALSLVAFSYRFCTAVRNSRPSANACFFRGDGLVAVEVETEACRLHARHRAIDTRARRRTETLYSRPDGYNSSILP